MSSEIALRLHGVSKSYFPDDAPLESLGRAIGLPSPALRRQGTTALRDVSFSLERGRSLGIIGRNGSGKSTLLRILCGVTTPTSGSVAVEGRIAALLELGAGFDPSASGIENIYIGAQVMGLTRRQVDERRRDIEAFADLGEQLRNPVRTYSSGMVVRLGFAIATQVDADVLIIDEALAVGDIYFVQKCMRFLADFQARGTLVFCTHDLGAVTTLADTALCLDQGAVVAFGEPDAVLGAYFALGAGSAARGDGAPPPRLEPKSGAVAPGSDWLSPGVLEVEPFRHGAPSFGSGGAAIRSAFLTAHDGAAGAPLRGGDAVDLVIEGVMESRVSSPIVGFNFKNRLGQVIFAENTHLAFPQPFRTWDKGDVFRATFVFRMPILPSGEFSLDLAIADGTQEHHVQLHWVHDAIAVRSRFPHHHGSLVVVPMDRVAFECVAAPACADTAAVSGEG